MELINPGTIRVQNLDIDSDNGPVDFQVNAGIILSDGVRSHCTQVTNVNVANRDIDIREDAPGGFTLADTRAVPAILYEVDPNLELSRNGLVLSTGVEDMQVEYWVDTGLTPGAIDDPNEFPVHDLNNPPAGLTMATAAIRSVRLTVITRSMGEDSGPNQKYDLGRRPSAGNRTAGPADSFRRRRFQVSVTPRNQRP